MNDQSFCLEPFPSARLLPSVSIEGSIARRAGTLTTAIACSAGCGTS